MQDSHPVSVLMFGTLIVVIVLAIALLLHFMRKRGNRHPMAGERERNIDEIHRDSPAED